MRTVLQFYKRIDFSPAVILNVRVIIVMARVGHEDIAYSLDEGTKQLPGKYLFDDFYQGNQNCW